MAHGTFRKHDAQPAHARPESPIFSGPGGFMLALGMAAAGGASFLGAWRVWCVPAQPLISVFPEVWETPAFALIGAAAGVLMAALWLSMNLPQPARVNPIVWAAFPLLFAWLPIGGTEGRIWTVFYLIVLAGAAGALGAYQLNRHELPDVSRRAAGIIVGGLITLFTISYSYAATLGLRSFYNGSYTDFGGFVNAGWNTLHGRLMWSDHWGGSIWGEHLTVYDVLPALMLLAWPRAESFLVWQAAITALAAIPIYLMARRDSSSRAFAIALAFAWIFSPFCGRNVMFEYHSLYFAALGMAWLMWACHPGVATWKFLLIGVAALVAREDMPLAIIGVGIWEAAVGRRWKRGLILIALCVVWGFLALNVLMPSAGAGHWTIRWGGSGHLDRYSHLGGTYGGIVKHILFEPAKTLAPLFEPARLANDLLLLLPLALLPILGWRRLWVAVPIFMLHALSNWRFQNELDVHYTSPLMPILFFAAIDGGRQLVAWLDRAKAHPDRAWRTIAAMLVGAALAGQLFTARWRPGIPPSLTPYDGRHYMTLLAFPWRTEMRERPDFANLFQDLRPAFPAGAGIAVQDPAVPLLATRHIVRGFRYTYAKPMDDLDYVLFHPKVPGYATRDLILDKLNRLIRDPNWHLAWVRQDWIVFAKNSAKSEAVTARLAELEKKYGDTPTGHMIVAQIAQQAGVADLARRESEKAKSLER